MKPISDVLGLQMPALPITMLCLLLLSSMAGGSVSVGDGNGVGVEGEGERRTRTKSSTPFAGEASMDWRNPDVCARVVCGAQDLLAEGLSFPVFDWSGGGYVG